MYFFNVFKYSPCKLGKMGFSEAHCGRGETLKWRDERSSQWGGVPS